MPKRAFFLVVLMMLAYAPCAIALESTDIEKSQAWNPPSPGPLNAWSAPLLEAGKLVIQPLFYYYNTRGTFNEDGAYKSFKDGERANQYVWDLVLYYSLTDKLEIDFEGFYHENYKGLSSGENAHDGNFGDSYVYARYCLQDEKDWMPCMTAVAQMKFPTGKYQKWDPTKLGTDITGTGSYDQGYGIIMTKKMKPLIFHADFIYNIPHLTKINGAKVNYADYMNCDAAVEYILPKGFSIMLEADYLQQGEEKVDGELISNTDSSSLLLVPGIGWSCDKVKVLICYQRTIAGVNTNINDSFAFTLIYTF